MMIKESMHQEDLIITCVYVPNIGASKNMKQKVAELESPFVPFTKFGNLCLVFVSSNIFCLYSSGV